MTDPVAGLRFAVRDLSTTGAVLYPSDRWTITTGSAMPGFDTSKLTGDILGDYWSAINHRSSCSWVQAQSDNVIVNRNLGVVSLIGINRRTPSAVLPGVTYGNNLFRLIVDTYPIASRVRPPMTLNSKVNLTGADANFTGHPLDPPDDPAPVGYAETKLTPTNPAIATSIVGTWANYYATERPLAGTCVVRFHLRDVNNPLLIPSVTASIWQSGSSVISLVSYVDLEHVEVGNSSGGFVFTYSFLASALASQTAAMELHLSTSTACDFIGVELVLDHSGYSYDSGLLDFPNVDMDSFTLRPDITISTTTYVYVEPGPFNSYLTTPFTRVIGGVLNAHIYSSIVNPGDPDGRFHAGRFLAADTIITPLASPSGWNLSSASDSTPARTRAGSFRGGRSPLEWTEADMTIIGISRLTVQAIERLIRTLGIMRVPTLLIPDPNMTEGYSDEQTRPRWMVVGSKAETHIGRFTGIDPDVLADGMNHTRDRWDMVLHWIDHNGQRSGGG